MLAKLFIAYLIIVLLVLTVISMRPRHSTKTSQPRNWDTWTITVTRDSNTTVYDKSSRIRFDQRYAEFIDRTGVRRVISGDYEAVIEDKAE